MRWFGVRTEGCARKSEWGCIVRVGVGHGGGDVIVNIVEDVFGGMVLYACMTGVVTAGGRASDS